MWFWFHNSVKYWVCAKEMPTSSCILVNSDNSMSDTHTAFRNFASLIFRKRKPTQQNRMRLQSLEKILKGCREMRRPFRINGTTLVNH